MFRVKGLQLRVEGSGIRVYGVEGLGRSGSFVNRVWGGQGLKRLEFRVLTVDGGNLSKSKCKSYRTCCKMFSIHS